MLVVSCAAAVALAAGCSSSAHSASGGAVGNSSRNSTGVTSTSIRVGITYPDLTQLQKTLNVDGGNYRDAYLTVINDVNAHGGIKGRKIVPYFAPVNVIGTAPAATACTQLTEDDHVLVAVGFFQAPDTACYLKTHDTPIIGASLDASQEVPGEAPWFNNLLSNDHLVPKELQIFNNQGIFGGHKVAVVGETADQQQMQQVVLPELKTLGVNVVATATEDSAPGDTAALDAQYNLIGQRFKTSGADVVVAVGDSGANWPAASGRNHSTYQPRLVATNENTLAGYTMNSSGYVPGGVKDAVSAISIPPASAWWNDPAMQQCIGMIQKAYPDDQIANPVTSPSKTKETWVAPQTACSQIPLLVKILTAAGNTLNNASFLTGGESLSNITLPGSDGTLSFGPGHHDGNGPMFLYEWQVATNSFKVTEANT
jgi:ABC-type branched-subunit amino acid transport system substrate-binding protein